MGDEKSKNQYLMLSSDLLAWIRDKIKTLNNHRFGNSVYDIQQELVKFNQYRTIEKPPKY